jgi:ribonucleoside-diphosphate reductase beta chain
MQDEVFNVDKSDYKSPSLLMGEQPGLFDTINKKFPDVWKLYKTQKALDWDENEFDYSSCNGEFKSCSKSTYDMMIKTLAWQWEADSVACRAIAPVLAPFITSSELWAAWQRVSDNEVLHAATYSEIVRSSFDDPDDILDEILSVQESLNRLTIIGKVFGEGYTLSHKYALGMVPKDQNTYNGLFKMIAALYVLERVQFMASFAITFAICDTGLFQPIGKAVQKIAQDELEVHAQLDKTVLKHEINHTVFGGVAYKQLAGEIKDMLDQVVDSEFAWVDYMFSEGRELVGLNADVLKKWVLFCAKDVYNFFGIKSEYTLPKQNPLKFMENWLDISKTQASPQEQDNAQYKVGIMRRDDANMEFDTDF